MAIEGLDVSQLCDIKHQLFFSSYSLVLSTSYQVTIVQLTSQMAQSSTTSVALLSPGLANNQESHAGEEHSQLGCGHGLGQVVVMETRFNNDTGTGGNTGAPDLIVNGSNNRNVENNGQVRGHSRGVGRGSRGGPRDSRVNGAPIAISEPIPSGVDHPEESVRLTEAEEEQIEELQRMYRVFLFNISSSFFQVLLQLSKLQDSKQRAMPPPPSKAPFQTVKSFRNHTVQPVMDTVL